MFHVGESDGWLNPQILLFHAVLHIFHVITITITIAAFGYPYMMRHAPVSEPVLRGSIYQKSSGYVNAFYLWVMTRLTAAVALLTLLSGCLSEPVLPAGISQPDAGVLLLLVPDNMDMTSPQISAWADAASEGGVRLQPITDTQFLRMGRGANEFAGLILPDAMHTYASDHLIAAITSYTKRGGNTMLVYDFGALERKQGVSFYAVPKSRMSALAGVDYVLYDRLRGKTTGLGPVRALRSTMRELLVPPGKSMPYDPLAVGSASDILHGAAGHTHTHTSHAAHTTLAGQLNSSGVSGETALYLPVSPQDPGGTLGFDPQQAVDATSRAPNVPTIASGTPLSTMVDFGATSKPAPVNGAMGATNTTTGQKPAPVTASGGTAAAVDDPLHAYNGYLLGHLIYPTYVTQGAFGWPTNPKQIVLADSAQFGLVAGVNPVGVGKVLFVNLPLTYLKKRTDALMMHGFVHYFTRNIINMPHLSAMPNGVAGITFDWHLDFMLAQEPTKKLMAMNVFNDPTALFSIEMTAGPDTISVGDRRGWNLPANPTAQEILKTFNTSGHSVGSHGGWIHDYSGANITESNQFASSGGACINPVTQVDNFEQCYVMNHQAVDSTIGRASRSYSAPLGNNPPWAMNWLEKRGVVAAYFAGHTGLGATRHYRDGRLLNPGMWVFPVTPSGTYATFEEWQTHNVPKEEISQWYRDLIDFNIAQNTSRLVYAHPPGAYRWSDVLLGMFQYAKAQQNAGKLNWYTMERLADFMTTRLDVKWSQHTNASGVTHFKASHPTSLHEMTWRLSKSRYVNAPLVVDGSATVQAHDAKYWLVKAGPGQSLVFTAKATAR